MKKSILKISGIIMAVLCMLSVIMYIITFFASGGTGVLDLTNVVRYFLAGAALITGLISALLIRCTKDK